MYSSVNLLCVGILYLTHGVWDRVVGVWDRVVGNCGHFDAGDGGDSHGLHSSGVRDGVAAWIAKNERQLLVPVLSVFSSVIALVWETAEVLQTEEK